MALMPATGGTKPCFRPPTRKTAGQGCSTNGNTKAAPIRIFSAVLDFPAEAKLSRFEAAASPWPAHRGGRVQVTNLPWRLDAQELAQRFDIARIRFINDFEAIALGIEALGPGDLETLQAGQPVEHAMRVVLGAGTGMGVAWLMWQEGRRVALATEAGHMDFAPGNELQTALLNHLRKKFGHVSWERVLSGPGLVEIFRFLQASIGAASGLEQMSLEEEGGAAVVADLALNRKHPLAAKALGLFVQCYGAFAGNLALAGLARGGVYIAGGIAPKIIAVLKQGAFIEAFCGKGRFSGLMQKIPVQVVMNPKAGLLGAALTAARE